MATCYRLARADTYTPIGYWMGLPLASLNKWVEVIAATQKEDKAK